MWDNVGLNNGSKGEVVHIIYKDKSGTRSVTIPEAVTVQFCESNDNIELFIVDIPITFAITFLYNEWKIPKGYNVAFIFQQLLVILLWCFIIHKAKGKTI